jgi:putative transposase
MASLRILEVTEIKTVPYVPLSHPFVERHIGAIRREYLDHMLFWTSADLENKLLDFTTYFNHHQAVSLGIPNDQKLPTPQLLPQARRMNW